MTEWPKQLRDARRCGAHCRTTGQACRNPAVRGRPRCRMHGCAPGSGSQPGERHARFKHGRYSRKTKELGARMRGLAKAGEVLVATAMSRHGLKPPGGAAAPQARSGGAERGAEQCGARRAWRPGSAGSEKC